jgi:hypothetical protein
MELHHPTKQLTPDVNLISLRSLIAVVPVVFPRCVE